MIRKYYFTIISIGLMILLSGCISQQTVQGSYYTPDRRIQGAVIGAAAGELIGSKGGSSSLWSRTVLSTAAVGAAAGVLVGDVVSRDSLTRSLNKQGVTVVAQGDQLRLVLSSDRLFELGTPMIRRDQQPTLNYVASLLKEYGNTPIMITGYTDKLMGSPRYQERVSLEEARSVLTYLWVHGIEFEHLYARGLGDKNPIASNRTVRGRALNRRVEICLRDGCS